MIVSELHIFSNKIVTKNIAYFLGQFSKLGVENLPFKLLLTKINKINTIPKVGIPDKKFGTSIRWNIIIKF